MNSQPSSSDSAGQRSAAFDRLEKRVQRWIWEQKWSELRDVQERTIHAILDSSVDLVVAAATAGGKTEAAFLPICSRLVGAPARGIQILYLSPLKALINDQHGRLEALCKELEIPVHRWHGDVDSGKKRRIREDPRGILLITPESLEAFFVLRGPELRSVFGSLEYVVIDELHAFMGTERGHQVQSLLHRLELTLRRRVRRIGLSATIGDMALAGRFLRPVGGQEAETIVSEAEGQAIHLQMRGYERSARWRGPKKDGPEDEVEEDSEDDLSIADHLFKVLRGRHNLVFANRRMDVELFADLLRRRCEELKVPNEFWPHHGNLSRDLRQDVEAMLKDRSRPASAICTSTLELGIDIGSVASVAQIGSPPSVSSMRQRLGRSGRRGEAAVLRVYVREEELSADSAPEDLLRLELVEAMAIVELLLRRWYEPPVEGRLHLSTLIQQTMSLIAQHGGVRAAEAYDALCRNGPFGGISAPMFAELLRSLGEADLLMQSGDEALLLGRTGERIVNHYDFFAAFMSPEEYRILTNGKSLGTIPIGQPLVEGMPLVFAGRRWRVTSFDEVQRVVEVAPSMSGKPPLFRGEGGAVHDEVRKEMRRILDGDTQFSYLDGTARKLLSEGRANFRRVGLSSKHMVLAGSTVHLFPWAGDRATNTLALHLRTLDFEAEASRGVITISEAPFEALMASLRRLAEAGAIDAVHLAAAVLNKRGEKYDGFLSEGLLCQEFASRSLDAQGSWQAIVRILEEEG